MLEEADNQIVNHLISSPFLVSVVLLTYNHVCFIRECLENILMEKTNFPFEICLGEDESNDGTREICIEYAQKYPDKIRLFLRSREDVIYINGSATGRFNLIQTLKECRGKYVALCEGDDYWTDPYKLQKQVDFMEANPEYILCQHKTLLKWDDAFWEDEVQYCPKEELNIHDILARNVFSAGNEREVIRTHTSSSLFRMSLFQNGLPPRFSEALNADHYLYLWASLHGKIRVLDDVMSVYRKHYNGISFTRFDTKEKYEKALIGMYRFFQQVLPNKYFYEIEYIIRGLQLMYELKYSYSGAGDTYVGRLKHAIWVWKNLIQKQYDRIALFGAGDHTQRFISLLRNKKLRLPKVVYDSNPKNDEIAGIPVKKPVSFLRPECDIIVLSTLEFQDSMRASISEIFGSNIPIFDFYEGY